MVKLEEKRMNVLNSATTTGNCVPTAGHGSFRTTRKKK